MVPTLKRQRSGSGPYLSTKRYRRSPCVYKKTPPALTYKRAFNERVKQLIQQQAEVKRSNADPIDYTFNANNATMSAPVDLLSQFVQIPQGAADGSRNGEQVRTKKATLKMLIQAPDLDGTSATAVLQLFVGYCKETPGTAPSNAQLLRIFDDGAATQDADGSLFSLMRPVNRDVFNIHTYKQIKIGAANANGFVNNDFQVYRKVYVDITKILGVLKYPLASVGFTPTNRHLYLWCNWVDPETGTTSTRPPKVQFTIDYTYTDI